MTEEQWLYCTDPMLMLNFLCDEGTVCDRKLRFWAAACCRRAWHLLDGGGRDAVETSERFADGLLSEVELIAAVWANRGCHSIEVRNAVDGAAVGAWRPASALLAVVCGQPPFPSPNDPAAPVRDQATEERVQTQLLRCVLGPLPFRTPRFEPRGQTPLVLSLAEAAYEERIAPDATQPGWLTLDPARLLVLADALEDAGANEPEIVEHLRQPVEHIRGCWPVDLLLGKE